MVYVVMMKELSTDIVTPVAVFDNITSAKEWMEKAINADGEDYGYKIEEVNFNPTDFVY